MSKVAKNIVTQGLSGQLGDIIVFRQRAGKTIVSAKPGRRAKDASVAQKEIHSKFQMAVLYAQAAIADPTTKLGYEAKASAGQSAYNVAVADYFNAPNIQHVEISGYTGQPGEPIYIKVTDDFKVKQVKVSIFKQDETLVESGLAVSAGNEMDWLYTTSVQNSPIGNGDKIVVEAMDTPNNVSVKEQVI